MCYVRVGTSKGGGKISGYNNKTGPWYLLGVLFQNFEQAPLFFLYGKPPPPLTSPKQLPWGQRKVAVVECCYGQ